MADKRKRAAPTIDLTATEVPGPSDSKSAPAQDAAAPQSEPPPPPQQPAAEPGPPPPHDFIKTIALPLAAGFAGAMLGGAVI